MNKDEKEGESYLDELLNTVAPNMDNDVKNKEKKSEEDVSLDDALAVLNDLPSTDQESEVSDNPDADMDELLGLLSEFSGDDSSDDDSDFDVEESNEPEIPNEPEPAPAQAQEPEPLMDAGIDMETQPEEEPASQDEVEPDLALVEPDLEKQEEPEKTNETASDESSDNSSFSDEPIAVDDIFQDALSAVGYSEDEKNSDVDDIFSLDDVASLLGEDNLDENNNPEEGNVDDSKKASEKKNPGKEKKPGLLKRIFGNIITEQSQKEEEKQRKALEEEEEKKAAEREEKKKQDAVAKEEKAKLAEEQKEKKKQKKEEDAERKAQLKEEKKRKKEEAAALAAKEVVGKLNPVGVTVVVIFFATIGLFVFIGFTLMEHKSTSAAENYYANEQYIKAYDEIYDSNLKEDNKDLYNKIRICSQLQKQMNSYSHYNKIGMKLEALDSLIKGIQMYDLHTKQAESLGITSEVNGLESQLAAALYNDYGLSETQARDFIAIKDRKEYTDKLQEIVNRVASNQQ